MSDPLIPQMLFQNLLGQSTGEALNPRKLRNDGDTISECSELSENELKAAVDDLWYIQWFDRERQRKWSVAVPEHKFCKKRNYNAEWDDVFYKAPYKYHLKVEINGIDAQYPIRLCGALDVCYENGERVQLQSNTKKMVISNNESNFNRMDNGAFECVFGGLQFNICSYKADNRKFRLTNYVYELVDKNDPSIGSSVSFPQKDGVQGNQVARLVACLISPPFTIRAKKPVSNPGSKKRKRDCSEISSEPPRKQSENLSELIDDVVNLSEDSQKVVLDQILDRANPIVKEFLRLKYFQPSMIPNRLTSYYPPPQPSQNNHQYFYNTHSNQHPSMYSRSGFDHLFDGLT